MHCEILIIILGFLVNARHPSSQTQVPFFNLTLDGLLVFAI